MKSSTSVSSDRITSIVTSPSNRTPRDAISEPTEQSDGLFSESSSLPAMTQGRVKNKPHAVRAFSLKRSNGTMDSSEPVVKRLQSPHSPTPVSEPRWSRGMQALFQDIENGKKDGLGKLPTWRLGQLDSGIYINMPHPASLKTPLTLALDKKLPDIAIGLLLLGADPDAQDGHGRAPAALANALEKRFLRFFALFAKAAVPSQDSKARQEILALLNTIEPTSGETMLGRAITMRNEELAERLIAQQADLLMKNADGKTPLDLAAGCGTLSMIHTLLEFWSAEPQSDGHCAYLHSAICEAVAADRPMVVAECLSVFRTSYREESATHAGAGRHREDAYHFFLSGQRPADLSVREAMQRTTNDYVLNEQECVQLALPKIEALAIKLDRNKVSEVIAAHTKPRY